MISSNESNGTLATQNENKENIPQPQAQDICYEKNQAQDLSSKEVLVEEAPHNKDISTLIFSDSKGAKTSLQDNFKKFRKERNDKCKSHVNLRNKRIKERHTKEFQQELREKFVETAKKYLGVPYAKRHLTPEDENYNAPLFLDCCGLVRKVMTDLKEDFGFQIGGWNQAYQFDTLPNEVPFEELKPGDLVFYSGTYFNPKKRKQKHDMVHVEIFLGGPTGEQTIGARYFKGVVSIFDSYKFNSKTYYDIKFYFRSLDTWLQGICKSACEQHLWLEDRDFYDSGKFSVFGEADADADASDGDDGEVTDKPEVKSQKTQNNGTKKIFIGKGNNDKLIKSYFAKDGYQVLDSNKMAFSDRFDLKWVQTTGEVDFLKFKEGSQLVNHIPNINVIGSKNGLIQTLRNFESQNPPNPSNTISIDDFMPDSYRLDVLEDELKFANCENSGIWITKPYHTNQGKNLKIITDIAKFKKDFLKTKKMTLGSTVFKEIFNTEVEEEKEDENFQKVETRVVIQKYIENPLLLNSKKFDIRCYVLISTMKPLFALFHSGYCRLCITDYSTELNEKGQLDKLQHLTNNSVQKRHPDYAKHKEESIWTMSKFEAYLQENNIADQAKINDLYSQIKSILAHCVRSAEPVLEKKSGYFQLLGCDILIDQNLKPYLLEINSNPAIFTDIQAHKEVIPQVVFKALDIVIELNNKSNKGNTGEQQQQLQDLLKNPEQLDLGTFEVLYNPLL